MTAIMIMAAGQSARFGGCKLLASVNDTTLLQQAISTANQCCPGKVFVVTGAWHNEVTAHGLKDATLIHHPDWAEGLGSSIAAGIKQLASNYDNILIMLADQINLTINDLSKLLNANDGKQITCGYYNNRRAVPAVFPKVWFNQLQQLSGDRGAQSLLKQAAKVVDMPNAAFDIDSKTDFDLWQKSYTSRT